MPLKPICISCHRFYRCIKNGFAFIEGMPEKHLARPGMEEPQHWKPYKLWRGDLWQCEGCGHETIAGVEFQPVAIQHEPHFKRMAELMDATFQVNDC